MKRCLTMLLMFIFLLTNTLAVLADGIDNDQTSNYPGVIDYREHQISADPTFSRPKAGFALQINSNGVLGNEILSGNHETETFILSTQDSPKITANAGDKIVISDRSSIGSGSKITQYDVQYRFTPIGGNGEDYNISE